MLPIWQDRLTFARSIEILIFLGLSLHEISTSFKGEGNSQADQFFFLIPDISKPSGTIIGVKWRHRSGKSGLSMLKQLPKVLPEVASLPNASFAVSRHFESS